MKRICLEQSLSAPEPFYDQERVSAKPIKYLWRTEHQQQTKTLLLLQRCIKLFFSTSVSHCNKWLFPPGCMKNRACIWLWCPFVSIALRRVSLEICNPAVHLTQEQRGSQTKILTPAASENIFSGEYPPCWHGHSSKCTLHAEKLSSGKLALRIRRSF